jgi:hypothetical protein
MSNYKGLLEATRFIGHDNIKIGVKISIKRKGIEETTWEM